MVLSLVKTMVLLLNYMITMMSPMMATTITIAPLSLSHLFDGA